MFTGTVAFHPGMDEYTLFQKYLEYTAFDQPGRIVSLAMHHHPSAPLYSAIWHYDPGHPKQALAMNVKLHEIDEVFQHMYEAYGMLPIIVTAAYGAVPTHAGEYLPDTYVIPGTGTDIRWTFVFEESPLSLSDLKFVDLQPYELLRYFYATAPDADPLDPRDLDLVSYDAIGIATGGVKYTGLLYPKKKPSLAQGMLAAWVPATGAPESFEAVNETVQMRSAWCHPSVVVPEPFSYATAPTDPVPLKRFVSAIWRDDVFAPWPDDMADPALDCGVRVVGPIPASAVQSTFDIMWADGWIPANIAVSGMGEDEPTWCIVYTRALRPLARSFHVMDARDAVDLSNLPDQRVGDLFPSQQSFWDGRPKGSRVSKYAAREATAMRTGSIGDRPRLRARGPRFGSPIGDQALPHTFQVLGRPRAKSELLSAVLGESKPIYAIAGGGGQAGLYAPGSKLSGRFSDALRYKAIDVYVRQRLRQNGARAAQLAVARGGRLVINRGYTNAEANYPKNNPTRHLFAPASICKAFTGMAAAFLFFPNGEIAKDEAGLRGIELPLDIALGIDETVDPNLKLYMNATTLGDLLDRRAGWPKTFVNTPTDTIAISNGSPPPDPGDMLKFVRSAPNFLTSLTGNYSDVYTATSVIALSERLSQRFVGSVDDSESADFVDRIRLWWNLPEEKARLGEYNAAARGLFNIFPQHPSALDLRDGPLFEVPGLRAELFQGNYLFDAAAGGIWMSAATVVRILSGMDPSSSMPELVPPAAVQRILDNDTKALFYRATGTVSGERLLIHNGAGPGAASVAGIYFPDGVAVPPPGKPTTVIAYMENWNDPDPVSGTWNAVDLNEMKLIVEDIEAEYGWEEGDLFGLE